jgi:hypothetical protein
MIRIQSKTFANSDMSFNGVPSGPIKGVTWVAAVIFATSGSWERKSWRKLRKLALSEDETLLFPAPCIPGYSQSLKRNSQSSKTGAGVTRVHVYAVQVKLVVHLNDILYKLVPVRVIRHGI